MYVPVRILAVGAMVAATAAGPTGPARLAPLVATSGPSVPGQYIVVMRAKPTGKAPAYKAHGAKVLHEFRHALTGYSATLTPDQLTAVRADPAVAYVALNGLVNPDTTITPATWGLDRLDQRSLPLNNRYDSNATGAGVTVYVIDSGIRATHTQVAGRVAGGVDFVGDGVGTDDCKGHGTFVAAAIGGSTLGVAPGVTLVPVRVFGCSGPADDATIVAAVDWVTANHAGPSVVNISSDGGANEALDDAVANSITAGLTYTVSAGNSKKDACTRTPARVATAITVAASTADDTRDFSYSNFGPCVTLFAPGTDVESAGIGSSTETITQSGTSPSAAYAAGAAALYLETNPTAPPAAVKAWMELHATFGVLTLDLFEASVNKLLYIGAADALPPVEAGDTNADGRADIVLTGGAGSYTMPVAASSGDGTFAVTNVPPLVDFPGWAQMTGARAVSGDFNGDGKTDVALVGGAGWSTVPVAFAGGAGRYSVTNARIGTFASLATAPGVRILTGDFNDDGYTDIALEPGPDLPWWTTQPVAFSNGDGSFTVTDTPIGDFAGWAQMLGDRAVTGDFNHDGRTDIALLPGPDMAWWTTQPIAFSNGDGTFTITNQPIGPFAGWAQVVGGQVVTGDYNHDGRTDLALLPGPNTPWWTTQPVAFSKGDGTFTVTNAPLHEFAGWAQATGVRVAPGDYNGDGRTDLALVPGPGTPWWTTQPVAFSKGDGTFTVTNVARADVASWAQVPGGRVLTGDFNGDRRTDLALLPGPNAPWWTTLPVAFSAGNGSFTVTNKPIGDFAGWAQMPGATAVPTRTTG